MISQRTWTTWASMMRRCFYPGDLCYHRYGGRGITVCSRWLKFSNFVSDMGDRPEGKTIDRIDNDKGYYPTNCKWSTVTEQNRNRSCTTFYTCHGRRGTLYELATLHKISPETAQWRLRTGMSPDEAFCKPVKKIKAANYLSDDQAKEIRKLSATMSRTQLATKFHVSYMAVKRILVGETHKLKPTDASPR